MTILAVLVLAVVFAVKIYYGSEFMSFEKDIEHENDDDVPEHITLVRARIAMKGLEHVTSVLYTAAR